jgi:hypothetical protein
MLLADGFRASPKLSSSFFAVHRSLKGVLENGHLLRDVPKLSPVHQTYYLEVFHSIVNQFAPKSTHFFYAAMLAR